MNIQRAVSTHLNTKTYDGSYLDKIRHQQFKALSAKQSQADTQMRSSKDAKSTFNRQKWQRVNQQLETMAESIANQFKKDNPTHTTISSRIDPSKANPIGLSAGRASSYQNQPATPKEGKRIKFERPARILSPASPSILSYDFELRGQQKLIMKTIDYNGAHRVFTPQAGSKRAKHPALSFAQAEVRAESSLDEPTLMRKTLRTQRGSNMPFPEEKVKVKSRRESLKPWENQESVTQTIEDAVKNDKPQEKEEEDLVTVELPATANPVADKKKRKKLGVFTPRQNYDFSKQLGSEDLMGKTYGLVQSSRIAQKSNVKLYQSALSVKGRARDRQLNNTRASLNKDLAVSRRTEFSNTVLQQTGHTTSWQRSDTFATEHGARDNVSKSIDNMVFKINQQRLFEQQPPATLKIENLKLPDDLKPVMPGTLHLLESSKSSNRTITMSNVGSPRPAPITPGQMGQRISVLSRIDKTKISSLRRSEIPDISTVTAQTQEVSRQLPTSPLKSVTLMPFDPIGHSAFNEVASPAARLSELLDLDEINDTCQGPIQQAPEPRDLYRKVVRPISFQKNLPDESLLAAVYKKQQILELANVSMWPKQWDTLDHRDPLTIYNERNPVLRGIADEQKINFMNDVVAKQVRSPPRIKTMLQRKPIISPKSLEQIRLKGQPPTENVIKTKKKPDRKEIDELLREMDIYNKKMNKMSETGTLVSIRRNAITPKELKAQITENILQYMDGDTEQERLRNMSLVALAERQQITDRKKFLAGIKVLLEMQSNVKERKFREQIIKADNKTQVFFNQILKSLNREKLEVSTINKASAKITGLNKSKLSMLTMSKLNLTHMLDQVAKEEGKQHKRSGTNIRLLGNTYGPAASELLKNLRLSLQRAVMLQMRLNARENRLTNFVSGNKKSDTAEPSWWQGIKSQHEQIEDMKSGDDSSQSERSRRRRSSNQLLERMTASGLPGSQTKLRNNQARSRNHLPKEKARTMGKSYSSSKSVSDNTSQESKDFEKAITSKLQVMKPSEKAYKRSRVGMTMKGQAVRRSREASRALLLRKMSSSMSPKFKRKVTKMLDIGVDELDPSPLKSYVSIDSPATPRDNAVAVPTAERNASPVHAYKTGNVKIDELLETPAKRLYKPAQFVWKTQESKQATRGNNNRRLTLNSLDFGQQKAVPEMTNSEYQETRQERVKRLILQFQKVVCEKIMKVPVDKVRNFDRRLITAQQTWHLLSFRDVVESLMPSGEIENLGSKYIQVSMNFFRNDYLREVIFHRVEYNDYLRVYTGDDDFRTEKIAALPENYLREEETDLNRIFEKQVKQTKFYEMAKMNNKIPAEYAEDQVVQAYWEYYHSCGREQGEVPISISLINFWNNQHFLYNRLISDDQAKAMRKFLMSSKQRPECRLREICYDNCQLTDAALAEILQGTISQIEPAVAREDGKQTFPHQYLLNLIISNSTVGKESLEPLKTLSKDLLDVRLNNIGTRTQFNNVITEFLDNLTISDKSPFLMKLALSNNLLNDEKTVNHLIDCLNVKKHLQFLDVSWCGLGPNALKRITDQLTSSRMLVQIRDVNLGYNRLQFHEPKSDEFQHGLKVIENLKTLFKEAKLLNHINLSGMAIPVEHLISMANEMSKSRLLMSFHMSDNGITRNLDTFIEVLDIFDLNLNDVSWKRIEMIDPLLVKYHEKEQYKPAQTKRQPIDIEQRVQVYMRFEAPNTHDKHGHQCKTHADLLEDTRIDKIINSRRKALRNHLFLGKEFRNYQHLKALNQSRDKYGIGRQTESNQDQFTLSRIINHPELCYNQRPDFDKDKNRRWFQVDANLVWQFQNNNDCLVCNRHQYTQIHYHRGVLARNRGLVEIKDKKIVEELRYRYGRDYVINRTDTPLIMGSVVKKFERQRLFDRTLKMLRTPLYVLLAISQCRDFFENQDQIVGLKKGVTQFAKKDAFELLQKIGVYRKLSGWKYILNDMQAHNELTDVRVINPPELSAYNVEAQDWYTFAAFLRPGYHQVVIYDPKLDRAFCKDFVVKMNLRDFVYPEYPIHLKDHKAQAIPNVWKPWIDDNPKRLEEIFNLEKESNEFNHERLLRRVVRSPEEMENVMATLKENMDKIVLYQKWLLVVGSKDYPQIPFDPIYASLMETQEEASQLKTKFAKAHIELTFQGATNSDGVAGLRGAMQRAELMNFLVRLVVTFNRLQIAAGGAPTISESMSYLLHLFIEPVCEDNPITKNRQIIRSSKKLNDLLYKNQEGLSRVYGHYKLFEQEGKNGFTINCARAFFSLLADRGVLDIDREEIDAAFVHSMMTVADEFEKTKKYTYLHYIEWLEMLCRLALVGYRGTDLEQSPIAFKVEDTLKGVWEMMYELSYFDRSDQNIQFVSIRDAIEKGN